MDLHLDEKVFVVTGGMGGIGKAIVFALAREGAIPVILDRTPLSAEYKTEIEKLTANYAAYEIDGHIDGIVNNAGANDNKSLEETSWREFEQSLHSNLTHYYETVHAAQKYLRDSAGAILNIGSKTALTGQGKTSAYAHNRMTTVEELADTAVFLLSDRSSHTTGQWIHPDGGYVHLDRAL